VYTQKQKDHAYININKDKISSEMCIPKNDY